MKRYRSSGVAELAERIERDIREIRSKLRLPLETEFARAQLTGPQRSVMQMVFRSGGMSLTQLSRAVGLSHSTVSGIVDRLVIRGMLARQVNRTDRRFSRIVVTEAVADFMEKKAPGMIARPMVQALMRATPSERRTVANGLETLRRIIGIGTVAED